MCLVARRKDCRKARQPSVPVIVGGKVLVLLALLATVGVGSKSVRPPTELVPPLGRLACT